MIFRTSLNIGHDGSTSAHVHDLMGCATLASTKERAISKLESTIPDYYRWLRSKGERIPAVRNPKATIIEEIRTHGSAGEAGGSDPLFSCDRIKCTHANISRCLQLLNYARADLDKIISKIPTEELDWKPRSEPRSIRNVMEHIRPSRHLVSVPDTRGSATRTEQNEGCLRISRLRPFPRTRGPTQTYDRTEKPNLSPKEMV